MKVLSEGGFCLTKSWITSVHSSWIEGKSWVGIRSRQAMIHWSSRPSKPTNHAVVSSIFRSAGIPFTFCVYSQDSVTRALEAEVVLGIRNPRAVFVPVAEVVRRASQKTECLVTEITVQLHNFSDASRQGYAAVLWQGLCHHSSWRGQSGWLTRNTGLVQWSLP